MKSEKISQLKQNPGCSSWLFGLGNLLIKISERLHKTAPQPEIVEVKPPHQAITGADLKYTHPELIPSQPEYIQQHGGKIQGAYRGQDPRGG